jgi:hypothetical protein
VAPFVIKASTSQDFIKAVPRNRVESFFEVQLQHGRRGVPFIAAAKKVRRVDKILSDVAPVDKAGLVSIDNGGYGCLKAVGHDLGEELHRAVLQGDPSEALRLVDAFLFGEDN